MTTTSFVFYSDPGHGWLMVNEDVLPKLGLTRASFSSYSYSCGGVLALEEDCDAGVFIEAWKKTHGCSPRITTETTNHDAMIRRWSGLS
jgi:hypothetical protein